jgi:hypothetical protein
MAMPALDSKTLTVVGAVVGFILLLTILWMVPRVVDAIIVLFERRRPLEPTERARVALAAHYARLNGMNDADLAGLPPLRRQAIWNVLANEWGIRGERSRKRALSHHMLEWLRDAGHRSDPRFAPPPGCDPGTRARALIAWDCSRLVFLSRLCFFAGYVEEGEAWQYIRAAARRLSSTFDSWTSYGDALLAGRELWAGKAELADAVRALLAKPDSPWQQYAWTNAVAP